MTHPSVPDPFAVFNQPAPRDGLPLWVEDPVLRHTLSILPASLLRRPVEYASVIGRAEMVEKGQRLATGPGPVLERFDAGGRRIDRVIYPEAYHDLLSLGIEVGYAALPWTSRDPGGHLAHAALVYLTTQVEPGVCCPMTMTYAAVPILREGGPLSRRLAHLATSSRYDPADAPLAGKQGATIGMAMTEKQGGSDVRANTTIARPDGDGFRLVGHKWFCSAPMSDAILTLARLPEGLTCFVVPRRMPGGELNEVHLMRLKNKLGNRSNASAEIEYRGAWAEMLGDPGEGIRTILDMVHHTRLDTATAPAGLMRRALAEAIYWSRHRSVFGKHLIDQPLMRAVLADMALEWMAATEIAMRVAAAFDAAQDDPAEAAFARLAVALAKYINNKRCPVVVCEAMECLGGMGYVEDTPAPWLYREAPLNAIWEGSGNVICLDVLRTLKKVPQAAEAFLAEIGSLRPANTELSATLGDIKTMISEGVEESAARKVVETMALALQASLMLRRTDPCCGELFTATRLAGNWGRTLGTLPSGTDTARIIDAACSPQT